jgi:hypothetical protein
MQLHMLNSTTKFAIFILHPNNLFRKLFIPHFHIIVPKRSLSNQSLAPSSLPNFIELKCVGSKKQNDDAPSGAQRDLSIDWLAENSEDISSDDNGGRCQKRGRPFRIGTPG